jgi:hypothetical protein
MVGEVPGSVPESDFFNYIRHNQYSSAYYYNATPEATTTEVTQALSLSDALYQFHEQSQGMTAHEFAAAYTQFLISVQNYLGEPGQVEWHIPARPTEDGVDGAGSTADSAALKGSADG